MSDTPFTDLLASLMEEARVSLLDELRKVDDEWWGAFPNNLTGLRSIIDHV